MMCGGEVRDHDRQRMPICQSADERAAESSTEESGEAGCCAVVARALTTALATVGGLGCLHLR